ncbi:SCP2 sterol-binding domain-containing protein [Salinispora fenicalii]|uniref:SCP2 sterol-binding domain-containing protein n=1 Tax=Salinispora fenicalii TaxID=1137263 RepID=UPI0004820252|nr:SCP2 sterol-binding domain-containing protein [Salinispora fenicalii]
MSEATTAFFKDLDRRGCEPLLMKITATVRFDLHEGAHTSHWFVRIDRGQLRVSREDRAADAVIGLSPELFEELAAGREHGIAASLRGDLTVSGDPRLFVQVERLFPGDPRSRGPRRVVEREVR